MAKRQDGPEPGGRPAGWGDHLPPPVVPVAGAGAAIDGSHRGELAGRAGGRSMMEPDRRAEVLLRLCRAAGHTQKVAGMVATDCYCADVLGELTVLREALDAVAALVTRNYLERCVTVAIQHGDPLIYDEVMRVIEPHR